MKILHLSKYYHPYRGGIEKVIKELSEASVKRGHDVTVICASENKTREESYVNGVRVIRLPLALTVFSQPVTPAIFSELRKELAACDVINVHTPNPMYEFALLQVQTDKPIVITYHCEVYKARALNNLYQPISQALLRRANKIIVGTTFHIDHSRWLPRFKEKCEI
ncbi:MAG: glycosyltransferase, partial [Bdellovibrionaceae bacterium]|nr:glycosyltransferase [Pseudobdellovibrionaceae bacterium]